MLAGELEGIMSELENCFEEFGAGVLASGSFGYQQDTEFLRTDGCLAN